MIKLWQTAGAAAILLLASVVQAQHPTYDTSYGSRSRLPFFRRGQQQQTNIAYGTQGANPYSAVPDNMAPQQGGDQGVPQEQYADPNDPRPSSNPMLKYEEVIPPTEQPSARGVMTVPAASAKTAVAANRRINFPRDKADDLDVLKLQVFLDYHGYSPGEIEGQWGYNTERALYVYQRNNGMQTTGQLDDRMLARLNAFQDGFLVDYGLSADDVKGPFFYIPRDYYAQAKLKWLPFESAIEKIGEKFHCAPILLRKLNPGVDFDNLQAGTRILAPNVLDGIDERRGQVGLIRVSKHNRWTEIFDHEGRFMFYFPSTLGSQYDPLPLGNWEVTSIVRNPPFKYQPKLFWDANKSDPEAMIPPGPNNPVGVVWIGTSRKSVGIHGTPNPENVSKTNSHGCIRLTNWDASQLAARIKEGTKIEFVD